MPYQHVGQTVEVRVTLRYRDLARKSPLGATPAGRAASQRFVNDPAHRPAHHRGAHDLKSSGELRRAGAPTAALVDALFARRRHPEQAIRSAQGIIGLARDHGKEALNSACTRARVERDWLPRS
ncbi:MAG: hypothetical protein IPO08_21190 [Xanthomonadales bacterium]|nr:hypothetical protein [Xanthomonadales bacterium]